MSNPYMALVDDEDNNPYFKLSKDNIPPWGKLLKEGAKVAFQTAQAPFMNAPQNIMENPRAFMIGGPVLAQMKPGFQFFQGAQKEQDLSEVLEPQTGVGKTAALVGSTISGSILPGAGAIKGMQAFIKFPAKKVLSVRAKFPHFEKEGFDAFENGMINAAKEASKRGKFLNSKDVAAAAERYIDDPFIQTKLPPKAMKEVENFYLKYSTLNKNVDPYEVIKDKNLIGEMSGIKNNPAYRSFSHSVNRSLKSEIPETEPIFKDYAQFASGRRVGKRIFAPKNAGEFETGSGEKALTNWFSQSSGTKRGLKYLEDKIKEPFIGSARAQSIVRSPYTLGSGLGIAGIGYLLNLLRKGGN